MIALIVLVLGFFIVVGCLNNQHSKPAMIGSLVCFAIGLVFPLFYVFTIILGLTSILMLIRHA